MRHLYLIPLLAAIACSDGETTSSGGGGGASSTTTASSTTGGQTSANEIGPEGGTLVSTDGVVRIVVPAGALDQTVTFSIGPDPSAPGGHLGEAYDIGPSGTEFAIPAKVTFNYAGSEPLGELRVATAEGRSWAALDGATVDEASNEVAGLTSHLSLFALVSVAEGTGGAGGSGGSGVGGGGGTGGSGGSGGDDSADILASIGTTPYMIAV